MIKYFPRWFFTRPAGFGLLLACVTLALWTREEFQRDPQPAILILGIAAAVSSLALLGVLWLGEFDLPHDYDQRQAQRWLCYAAMALTAWAIWEQRRSGALWWAAFFAAWLAVVTWLVARLSVPKPGERRRGEPVREAWLVVTLDLTAEPPVAIRAAIFSCKGSQLTTITQKELNLDVAYGIGDSYSESADYLRKLVPLHYPYLVPLLRKSGERV